MQFIRKRSRLVSFNTHTCTPIHRELCSPQIHAIFLKTTMRDHSSQAPAVCSLHKDILIPREIPSLIDLHPPLLVVDLPLSSVLTTFLRSSFRSPSLCSHLRRPLSSLCLAIIPGPINLPVSSFSHNLQLPQLLFLIKIAIVNATEAYKSHFSTFNIPKKPEIMPTSMVDNVSKEKKYPFVFAFSLLLIFVTFLLISNSETQFLIPSTDLTQTQSQLKSSSVNSSAPIPVSLSPIANSPKESVGPLQDDVDVDTSNVTLDIQWRPCKGSVAVDYIPCLDNLQAIKVLQSRRHMEHRERHCPMPSPRCLVLLPTGYKSPVPWPKSRDMIWYDNVPHPKLVDYKKDQHWVVKSGDYLVFPGGGTQFKDGVDHYIESIEKTFPAIGWGRHTRVILDVGCGVASFGGYLLDKNVITMSFAPKDEHEAQIQFALERGIPATLSVIGTQRLTYPDNAYDLIHCARCRVHWDADGGKPLMELNRILRPGGYFIWSATPIYRKGQRDQSVWKAMVSLTEAICWKVVKKAFFDSQRIGLVIYQKPLLSSCYGMRKENNPPLCDVNNRPNTSWYVPLDSCLAPLPSAGISDAYNWPEPWPERLKSKPSSLSKESDGEEIFNEDTKHWSALVSDVYLGELPINWSRVRNVMDMNAGYGGFAAALRDQPLWVMNVVPIHGPDTLPVIFDRGLIGIYHDWCESFNTYPRTYDLLHSSFLFRNLTQRCDLMDAAVEMDRILRPGGILLVQDTIEMIKKLRSVLESLHWSTTIHQEQFLVGEKGFWRPR